MTNPTPPLHRPLFLTTLFLTGCLFTSEPDPGHINAPPFSDAGAGGNGGMPGGDPDGGGGGQGGDLRDSALAPPDAGSADATPEADARPSDAQSSDADLSDAQPSDADPSDAQPSDADPSDAQPSDHGCHPTDTHPADAICHPAPDAHLN